MRVFGSETLIQIWGWVCFFFFSSFLTVDLEQQLLQSNLNHGMVRTARHSCDLLVISKMRTLTPGKF